MAAQNLAFVPYMNRRNAKAEQPVARAKSSGPHKLREAFGGQEGQGAFGQVGVGGGVATDQCAHAGQNLAKVKAEQRTKQPRRGRRKLQNHGAAPRPQHAPHLGQPLRVVRKVAKAEGAGHGVKTGVWVRQF